MSEKSTTVSQVELRDYLEGSAHFNAIVNMPYVYRLIERRQMASKEILNGNTDSSLVGLIELFNRDIKKLLSIPE